MMGNAHSGRALELDAVIQFVGRVYLFLVYYMKYGYGRFSLEAENSL